ncbi:MAG TPA: hypothetical protein VFT72_03790 [Opitutaceae bacterium]|nr:hypothetical protein [Opitutaceae bacterium]
MKWLFILFVASFLTGCVPAQRKFLFYPTHRSVTNGLAEWKDEGHVIGYSRRIPDSSVVWLFLHGNAGQAADRVYALPHFASSDSVFILEYPGYGQRSGKPSRASFDEAAVAAYHLLRRTYPHARICAVGESIGSGPASALARDSIPPDKIVLIVPFDSLKSVASEHVRYFPVGLALAGMWNNVDALGSYKGSVDIFAAEGDTVIPISHARILVEKIPQSKLHVIRGGHNEWSQQPEVLIRFP